MQVHPINQHAVPNGQVPGAAPNSAGAARNPASKLFAETSPSAKSKLIVLAVLGVVVVAMVLFGIASLQTSQDRQGLEEALPRAHTASGTPALAPSQPQTGSLFGDAAHAASSSVSGSGQIIGIVGTRTTTRF